MASPFLLEPHDSNPVIERPSQDGGAMLPHVPAIDDQLHMWFTQSSDWTSIPTAIYHATSADGMDWTIDEAPALTADGNGFDAFSVGEGVVVADGEQWVMFYNAREIPGPGPGPAIGRATAPSPAGPWTADPDPILRVGEGAWDSGFVTPNAAISDDGSITIIYSGGTDYSGFEATSLGLAHAQNGVSFTKHDQPVMSGVDGWDGHYV